MTKKELLYKIKEELEQNANDISLDFVSDYDIESSNYLSDAFTEFSDNQISVYYSDQFKYYEENPEECESALLNLYDGESVAQYIKDRGLYELCCHAGVCGQYERNFGELSEDEGTIKKLLVVRYLIKNDIFTLNEEKLEELLDEVEEIEIDYINELLEIVERYTSQESEDK